jgi:hypothetical protein
MEAVRSPIFLIPDRPRWKSAAQAAEALRLSPLHWRRWMTRGVVPRQACWASGFLRLCCGKERRARARVFDWRQHPGPPMRSAWERQCAGPLCLPARALSSASGGGRWGRCGSRRTGFTTAIVVSCRYGFAYAAIMATCTAPGSARRSAGASRCDGRKLDISAPVAVRCGTLIASVGGERDNDKNQR